MHGEYQRLGAWGERVLICDCRDFVLIELHFQLDLEELGSQGVKVNVTKSSGTEGRVFVGTGRVNVDAGRHTFKVKCKMLAVLTTVRRCEVRSR